MRILGWLSVVSYATINFSYYNFVAYAFAKVHLTFLLNFSLKVRVISNLLALFYRDYENGKCSISCDRADNCNSMGRRARKPSTSGYNKYYLHTTGVENNFCGRNCLKMSSHLLEFQTKCSLGAYSGTMSMNDKKSAQ